MTNSKSETYWLLEVLKPITLVILTAISGTVVGSFHNCEWAGFLAYLLAGFSAGNIAGGPF